jgi:toxin ParE1/3/4
MNELAEFPDRGAKLSEIEALERRQYRQVFFKPYRIVYSVVGSRAYVHLIADKRRDFRSLLAQRLIR